MQIYGRIIVICERNKKKPCESQTAFRAIRAKKRAAEWMER
jgi:hypothetical protein